jgi:hypothetical protein
VNLVSANILINIRQDSMAPQGVFWEGGTGPNQLFQSIKRAPAATPGQPVGLRPAGAGEGGRPGDEKSSSQQLFGPSGPTNWENRRSISLFSSGGEDEDPVSSATVRHAVPTEGGD